MKCNRQSKKARCIVAAVCFHQDYVYQKLETAKKKKAKKENKLVTHLILLVHLYMNSFPVCSDVTDDMLSLMTSSWPEVDCSL